MKRIREGLTFSNVVACLALFIALGGASYAAVNLPKNSVGSRELKPKAVKAGNLAREAVRTAKIAKGAITTNRLRSDAVTGAKVDEATLGKVPSAGRADIAAQAEDAATLGGLVPGAFVGGGGESLAGRALLQLGGGGKQHVLDVPGYGEVVGGCGSGGGTVAFVNESGGTLRVLSVAGSEVGAETIEDNLKSELVPTGVGSAGLGVLQVGSTDFSDQKLLTVIVTREAQSASKCGVQAWAITR